MIAFLFEQKARSQARRRGKRITLIKLGKMKK